MQGARMWKKGKNDDLTLGSNDEGDDERSAKGECDEEGGGGGGIQLYSKRTTGEKESTARLEKKNQPDSIETKDGIPSVQNKNNS